VSSARPLAGWATLALALAACGGDATSPVARDATSVTLTFSALTRLDQSAGRYDAWLADANGAALRLGVVADPAVASTFMLPREVRAGDELWITLEQSGEASSAPSSQRLLRGAFSGAHADLSIVGAVTEKGLALRAKPGQFTMFSPSDNGAHGYPSNEESGVWLFNMQPRETEQGDMWVRLTQLTPGWTYEGWMVRDIGQAGAIWLSYGKFLPDYTGAVNSRDDTGWGPFSGVVNFRTDGEEEFPGDDWISNPLNLSFPAQLSLPLNLREKNASGQLRWTHVISIEPVWKRGEAVGSERPFVVRPYQDSFGDAAPGVARTITFHPEAVPRGQADLK